ncbi:MAG TPA: zinc ribbon domain-containing protein [Gaiellaceae bacterium]|jgi:putative FmdB family regulatory protein|nr:zinc ribbon domain-containing protein [Gaiellaceae bacterium]
MPIYEYRCPDGHTFEVFQRMTDAPVRKCEVCGKSPVEKVLFPVAVHFKGSGFYSTDYGKGGRKSGSKDGDAPSGDKAETKKDAAPAKDAGGGEKKAAAAD